MARRTRWTELGFGIIAALVILAAAGLILVFGRVGQLHGKKFTLFVTSDAARGVIRGSEVWLDGRRIGSVRGIDFQPPQTNKKERLVISLHLLDETRPHIRRNSKVQVRSGLNIIGDQVIYLSSGTPDQPSVADGDTLRATEQADLEGFTSDAALAAKQFPGIIENVKLIGAQLRSAEGTLGALGLDHGRTSFRPLRATTRRLLNDFKDSLGTLSLALHNAQVWRTAAADAMAVADSIRTLVASDRHSFGRFRRDSTLASDVRRTRDQLASLLDHASTSDGIIGRVRADSSIAMAVRRDRLALDSLMRDMKRHPLRYIAF